MPVRPSVESTTVRDSASFRLLVRRLYVWGAAMTVVFTVLYAVGGQDFLGLLTSDTHVVRAAMRYLPWAVAIPSVV